MPDYQHPSLFPNLPVLIEAPCSTQNSPERATALHLAEAVQARGSGISKRARSKLSSTAASVRETLGKSANSSAGTDRPLTESTSSEKILSVAKLEELDAQHHTPVFLYTQQIEGEVADDGHVGGSIVDSTPGDGLLEFGAEHPREQGLDSPVGADDGARLDGGTGAPGHVVATAVGGGAKFEQPVFAEKHLRQPKQAAKRQGPGGADADAACSNMRPIARFEADEVFLPVREVAKRFFVSVQTIWRWKKEWADFPKPVEITAGTTRWRLSDLVEFERKLRSKA
jgi:predicted DNA-binding transcriptional regulator AlpA